MKLFTPHYNNIDMIGAITFSILLSQGQWIMAIIIGITGAGISVLGNGALKLHHMNRQWQQLADRDDYIAAIRKHRELFKSGLQEAKKAVDEYRSKVKA